MTYLYLVRHGETELNKEKVYYGFSNPPINLSGELQCEKVKNSLLDTDFHVVISSPLERALRSAEIISSLSRENFVIYQELKELNFGLWEGKHYSQVEKEFSEQWKYWSEDWINYEIPKGESFIMFYNRVKQCIEEIVRKYENRKILIVAHGGTMKVISTVLLNLNLEDYWKFSFEAGTYSMFEINENNVVLKKINSI